MNKFSKYLLLLPLLAIIASSCVIKKYNQPEFNAQADSLFRPVDMQVDTANNAAMLHWSEFFTDTILKRYIKTVLDNNLDMLSARKNIEIAYAQLRTARATIAPSIGPAQIGFGAISDNGGGFNLGNQLSIGASWEIDIWGKLLSGKRASQAALMASHEGVQTLQTTLVSSMATAYYQLVSLDIQKTIAEQTIINRRQYLDTIRIMKSAGKVNEVAVQQALAQLSEVQASLPTIELAIINTENAVSMLMGQPSAHGSLIRKNSVDIEDAKILTDVGVPAQMLSLRPDVRAAEQQFRNAFELYNVSRASMYPSLSLSGTGTMADLFNAQTLTFNLLAGLTQPIFNGRRLRTQNEVADLQQQQAKLAFQKSVLMAGQEVSDAMAAQLKTKQKSEAQKMQLGAYEKAYEFSFELFVNGYATYLDVLTAQTGVFNTQMSLLQTFRDNIAARIDLYRALGGGAEAAMSQRDVIEQSKTQSENYKEELKAAKKAAREAKRLGGK